MYLQINTFLFCKDFTVVKKLFFFIFLVYIIVLRLNVPWQLEFYSSDTNMEKIAIHKKNLNLKS